MHPLSNPPNITIDEMKAVVDQMLNAACGEENQADDYNEKEGDESEESEDPDRLDHEVSELEQKLGGLREKAHLTRKQKELDSVLSQSYLDDLRRFQVRVSAEEEKVVEEGFLFSQGCYMGRHVTRYRVTKITYLPSEDSFRINFGKREDEEKCAEPRYRTGQPTYCEKPRFNWWEPNLDISSERLDLLAKYCCVVDRLGDLVKNAKTIAAKALPSGQRLIPEKCD